MATSELKKLQQKLARTLFSIERTSQHDSYHVNQFSPPIYQELAHHIVNDEENLLELVSQLNTIGEHLAESQISEAEESPSETLHRIMEELHKEGEEEALEDAEEFLDNSPITVPIEMCGVRVGWMVSKTKVYQEVFNHLEGSIKKLKLVDGMFKGKKLSIDIINAMIDEVLEENHIPKEATQGLYVNQVNDKGWFFRA